MSKIVQLKMNGYDMFFCKMTTSPSNPVQFDPVFLFAGVGIVVVIIAVLVWRKR